MKQRISRAIACLFFMGLISGCAVWKPIKENSARWHSGAFSATLPIGWAKSQTPEYFLLLTYHGVTLQQISLSTEKTGKELPVSKKIITEDMLLKDIADVVSFLCSEEARWIIGQTIIADGGYSLLP